MTIKEAKRNFKDSFPKEGKDSFNELKKHDKPALREAWSFYIDNLHRDGEITDKQAQNWGQII